MRAWLSVMRCESLKEKIGRVYARVRTGKGTESIESEAGLQKEGAEKDVEISASDFAISIRGELSSRMGKVVYLSPAKVGMGETTHSSPTEVGEGGDGGVVVSKDPRH